MKRLFAVLSGILPLLSPAAEETCDFNRGYIGVSAALTLPQGGSRLRRVGGAAVRGGWYLTEDCAVEADAAWLEDFAGLSASALGHLQGWSLYGDLFGYSRFDPFVTFGARGWIGGRCGQVGPKAGAGAFYHLTDEWSLRFDADAALGLETRREMLYTFTAGVQYSF
ncbi:MAG: hypothetical protein J6T01_04525 [Kiritimatiellae bacterium]|nr:hypothetical protein [Kiritimatiellia bacterium]